MKIIKKLINLFGVIFQISDAVITWIGFYLWYATEYLCIMLSCKWNKQSDRYHDVSFEEEAHNNDKNLNYCKERKHYAWFKYLKIGSYKSKKEK